MHQTDSDRVLCAPLRNIVNLLDHKPKCDVWTYDQEWASQLQKAMEEAIEALCCLERKYPCK